MAGPLGRCDGTLSLLAGHREITGGGEASIERGRSGGSHFRIVERQCRNGSVDQPFKYVATWLIDEWSKIGLRVTQRVVPKRLRLRLTDYAVYPSEP